jgi:hypothetical protein
MDRFPLNHAGRRLVLRAPRRDPRPSVRAGRDPDAATENSSRGRGSPPVRAPSLSRPPRYADVVVNHLVVGEFGLVLSA